MLRSTSAGRAAAANAKHDSFACVGEFLTSCGRAAQVPTKCTGVPENILNPAAQWADKAEFDDTLSHLADLYEVRHKCLNSGTVAADHAWLLRGL